MADKKTKARNVMVITAVVAFVVSSWLFANWDEFKAGVTGGPEPQVQSQP